jgi:hypothetical protein
MLGSGKNRNAVDATGYMFQPTSAGKESQLRRIDAQIPGLEGGHVAVMIGRCLDEGVEDRRYHVRKRIK